MRFLNTLAARQTLSALLLCASLGAGAATSPAPSPAAATATTAALRGNSGNSGNSDAICAEFFRRLPNVTPTLCQKARLLPSGARSVKGRPLVMRDVQPEAPRLRVLVIGGIHGDELSAASLALHWIAMAEQEPAETPHPIQWRFVPAVNPDGLLLQPPQRMNAHGVDLNRNFPTHNWERDARTYWEKRTRKDPRRWPGPKPLSEPETQFIYEQIASFKPQLIVSIHAPYGVLDFDGPSVPPSKLGRLYLDPVGIFPGSLGNYGGVQLGIPVVTVELPNAMRTPLDAEMGQMWLDLQRWISAKLWPSLTPVVRTDAPAAAASSPATQ